MDEIEKGASARDRSRTRRRVAAAGRKKLVRPVWLPYKAVKHVDSRLVSSRVRTSPCLLSLASSVLHLGIATKELQDVQTAWGWDGGGWCGVGEPTKVRATHRSHLSTTNIFFVAPSPSLPIFLTQVKPEIICKTLYRTISVILSGLSGRNCTVVW